jgi:hypothetical protein
LLAGSEREAQARGADTGSGRGAHAPIRAPRRRCPRPRSKRISRRAPLPSEPGSPPDRGRRLPRQCRARAAPRAASACRNSLRENACVTWRWLSTYARGHAAWSLRQKVLASCAAGPVCKSQPAWSSTWKRSSATQREE